MNPARLIALMGDASAQYITSHIVSLATTSGVISWSGASAGDLAVIHTFNDFDGNLTAPAGWTTDSQTLTGYATQMFQKVLTSTDISAGSGTWTATGFHPSSFAVTVIYRTASAATRKSTASGTSSTLALTGFTPSPQSRGVVTFVMTYNAVTPGTPTGFTSRIEGTEGSAVAAWADMLKSYAAGTVTWTGFSSSGNKYAWLVELT